MFTRFPPPLGRQMALVDQYISGLVHLGLPMEPAGNIDLLRSCLRCMFAAWLRVHFGARPTGMSSTAGTHRAAVLDLFLSDNTEKTERRKAMISDFLNGDWHNAAREVQHWCAPGNSVNRVHCLKLFQHDVVMALPPRSLQFFPRRRSTGAEKSARIVARARRGVVAMCQGRSGAMHGRLRAQGSAGRLGAERNRHGAGGA